MRRRSVLSLLGLGGAGWIASRAADGLAASAQEVGPWPFQPVATPLPVNSDGLSAAQQQRAYREVAVEDRLVVPEGFRSDLLAAWGDPLATGRFGFNNDYLGFVPLG
jgi:Predicted phosphatase